MSFGNIPSCQEESRQPNQPRADMRDVVGQYLVDHEHAQAIVPVTNS